MYIYMYISLSLSIYIYIYIYICVGVYVYIYIYIFIYLFIYPESEFLESSSYEPGNSAPRKINKSDPVEAPEIPDSWFVNIHNTYICIYIYT